MSNWFEVDKEGLSRILKRRGLQFLVFELVSNAWDSDATRVDVTLEPIFAKSLAKLTVTDNDKQGFANPRHAYTMFADSTRRDNPLQRGRFNLGEKLVLAVAKEAKIVSMTAGFKFDSSGRRNIKERTKEGTVVELIFPCTREELSQISEAMDYILPPVYTTFNNRELIVGDPLAVFDAQLQTVLPDAEGNLKPTTRKTKVQVFNGAMGWLYELGIPVVETGDKYSYNVMQKVPVNLDRDNVPPSYLRTLRVMALNELFDKLEAEDSNTPWVRDSLSDKRVSSEAVQASIKQRFGDKVVSYDPSDPEANKLAVSQGYVVIHGNQMSKQEWENVRNADVVLPAGQVTPSPKPYSPDGKPLNVLPEDKWTEGMREIANYAELFFKEITGHKVRVIIANEFGWGVSATYGKGSPLVLNVGNLGKKWFEQGVTDEVVELMIHEAGHEYSCDHLSSAYHKALCRIGAKLRHSRI